MGRPTVIVVNSLVSRGSVGGRASVFALERLGFPIVFVPTIVLPWHPGHGRATRLTPDGDTFGALLADLAGAPWLGTVGALLTGYFGAAEQIAPTARLVAAVKAANPRAIHLCDPNIGDAGALFQPASVAAAIRDHLLPLADVTTPNRFELGWLAGDAGDPLAAARRLAPAEILVTSAAADPARRTIETLVISPAGTLGLSHRWLPDSTVHGTGDLFAALYLGHRLDGALAGEAAARAAASVLAMIDAAKAGGLDEIPLAAAQEAILAPPGGVTVEKR